MENLNYLFNIGFYEKLNYNEQGNLIIDDIADKLNALTGCSFTAKDYEPCIAATKTFLLKTTYPGLLIGSGNAHGVSLDKQFIEDTGANDAKLGFSFDYVTGQPYIPGSSVKGVMRSLFKKGAEVIRGVTGCNYSDDLIKALEKDIFESKGECFLDAVIRCGNSDGKILGTDFITPHPTECSNGITVNIKNPKPLQFIKVLPKVILEFRFRLTDSEIDGKTVTADDKIKVLKSIIEFTGAGAKTNEGYGMFEPAEERDVFFPAQNDTNTAANRPEAANVIEVGRTVTGTVKKIFAERKFAIIAIDGTNKTGTVHISETANRFVANINDVLTEGQQVRAKILEHTPACGGEREKIKLSIKRAD